MATVIPNYYKHFQCISHACQHSCCIGWEIDIDEKALSYYDSLGGKLGLQLKNHIVRENPPHFRLDAKERCPFLNQENLCELIIQKGENALCQICTDHPRFRNVLCGRTELGLGLCCEAAGALILGMKEPLQLLIQEDNSKPACCSKWEYFLFGTRETLFSLLQNSLIPFHRRVQTMIQNWNLLLPCKSSQEWITLFLSLERLDPVWTESLQNLHHCCIGENITILDEESLPFEQLIQYFLYRYLAVAVDEQELKMYLSFAILSTQMIASFYIQKKQQGDCRLSDFVEIARLYSSEIEYSEENMDILLDLLWQEYL